MTIKRNVFEDLFVLEMANNHWGDLDRGLKIVQDFSKVARYNNVRAAIKVQFRDVGSFIHPAYRDREDVRYIKKTLDTEMSVESFEILIAAIRKNNCIPMATPLTSTTGC